MDLIDFDFDDNNLVGEMICLNSTITMRNCNCTVCRSDNEESLGYVKNPEWMGNKDAFEMMMKGM